MELWATVAGEKKKYQGSFKKVMEELFFDGKEKDVRLLSVHAPKKELRRFKREWRKTGKDLVETARMIARWFYLKELRRANRCIKDLRKKTDLVSKRKVEAARKTVSEIRPKLEALS